MNRIGPLDVLCRTRGFLLREGAGGGGTESVCIVDTVGRKLGGGGGGGGGVSPSTFACTVLLCTL